jgi:hypothetical protein
MDEPGKAFTSEGVEARQWIGRIIMAVILGEAIWSLIVSVMNNLVVPWLGDMMGPSSGLPTSFVQRPYDYPALFVSVVELCLAVIVALSLNYVFQRSTAGRAKRGQRLVSTAPAAPARDAGRSAAAPQAREAMTEIKSPVPPPAPLARPAPAAPPSPVASPPPPPAPHLAPAAAPPPAAPVAAAKPQPSAPKKPKEVYYNIVGEPVSSDED